ncbi:hypothetical protein ACFOLD_10150 [Kocuria carniphila]|uniref:hypothetical protein n=1 Tax=Kocuria carniphila TaxID=262208 RepID=UPI00360CD843
MAEWPVFLGFCHRRGRRRSGTLRTQGTRAASSGGEKRGYGTMVNLTWPSPPRSAMRSTSAT